MKKPTPEQLKQVKENIEAQVENKGVNTFNPVRIVADKYNRSKQSVYNLLCNKVDDWKPHHFDIYKELLIYVK